MPCRDDYPEPSQADRNSQEAAKNLVYLYGKLGQPVSAELKSAAQSCYKVGKVDRVNELCTLLTNMTEKERDKLIYNARDKGARALADWWEEHEEQDRRRLAEEKALAARCRARIAAIKKLTREEIDLLGIPDYKIANWAKGKERDY